MTCGFACSVVSYRQEMMLRVTPVFNSTSGKNIKKFSEMGLNNGVIYFEK